MFLAIDIPARIREALEKIQNDFKALNLDAAWVKPGNIHLTLKFLGDTESLKIPEIKESMKQVAISAPRFSMAMGEIGVFPNPSRPRVLWVGVEERQGHLITLHQQIEKGMAAIGFAEETRKFSSHLTLGRIKSSRGGRALQRKLASRGPVDAEPFEVSSFVLLQSELTPQGSIYTSLQEFTLNRSVH